MLAARRRAVEASVRPHARLQLEPRRRAAAQIFPAAKAQRVARRKEIVLFQFRNQSCAVGRKFLNHDPRVEATVERDARGAADLCNSEARRSQRADDCHCH